ncbi:V4R domain-containing protein [Candidatus Palauibacter sp.]|uniref:V4R domain-containing protein n=1 Tax=Candidatus Palauibacter sp. TaxID=3101350 RepID=UPI003B51CC02
MILPRSVLADLFHRCASLGDAGIAALNEAGDRTGAEAVALLGDSPDALTAAECWAFLDEILRKAGLGSISFKPGGGASAAIAWRDSAEATARSTGGAAGLAKGAAGLAKGAAGTTDDAVGNARCHFATALLRGVLSRLAKRPVEVAEVQCGGGAEPCWFLFGSAETIDRVRTGDPSRAGSREH